MKSNWRILKKLLLVTSMAILIVGCETVPKDSIVSGTVNFNMDLEEAQNEMLLLNIVRASERHPMYFTAITGITGSSTSTYNFGIGSSTIPFARFGSGSGLYSIGPTATASYSVNPVLSMAPLDTQKNFIRGMFNAVSPETVAYYWNQGWPKEMLLYIFVDHIEKDGKTLSNRPFASGYGDFQDEIANITNPENQCYFKAPQITNTIIGPEISNAIVNASDLESLVEVQKAGLKLGLDNATGNYQLLKSKQDVYSLRCKSGPIKALFFAEQPDKTKKETDAPQNIGAEMKIYLRSPEQILYYLGELIRPGNQVETTEMYYANECPSSKQVEKQEINKKKLCFCTSKLFDAHKAVKTADKNPFVAVDYEGIKYVISNRSSGELCPKDRSMHVLSLLSLLIDQLQSSVELPPPTPVVTTVGGTK